MRRFGVNAAGWSVGGRAGFRRHGSRRGGVWWSGMENVFVLAEGRDVTIVCPLAPK